MGVRAEQDIEANQFIYEYKGEVIEEMEFRDRLIDYDQRHFKHFYFMMLQNGEFIDATIKGSLARFCNHSCSPNAYVNKWVVKDKLRMGIFAQRKILKGEEITFDYNVDRYGGLKLRNATVRSQIVLGFSVVRLKQMRHLYCPRTSPMPWE